MKKEFIVERQGRIFCLYAGLLDLAHQHGLKSIRTELVQAPTEQTRNVAIAAATVVLERDGVERTFSGIGDAAPNNVAPAMQSCLIRMAETRAKARALRDAVNIGVAAFEELGEADAQDGAAEGGYGLRTNTRSVRQPSTPVERRPGPLPGEGRMPVSSHDADASALRTEDQANAVRNLCKRLGLEPDAVCRERPGGLPLGEISQAQAAELIRTLSSETRVRARAEAP